jgi:hypothetical protein
MIQLVHYAEILESTDLLAEYAAECSIPEIGTACPQAAIYAEMERLGIVQVFGAYTHDRLAGFASVLFSVLPHYGRMVATVESLFVGKGNATDGSLGTELIAAIESDSRQRGCVAILYSAPVDGRLEKLLTLRRPYRHTNAIFCRSLL